MNIPEFAKPWLELAASTPSADNSQPWQFALEGSTLTARFRKRQASSLFGEDSHGTLLSVGAMAHMLNTCGAKTALFPERSPEFLRAELPQFSPEQATLYLQRHTNRHPFKTGGVDADSLHGIHLDIYGSDTHVHWATHPEQINALAQCVGDLSFHRFKSPSQHASLMGSLRFTPDAAARGDGLDLATLHLPPGGGAFMRWITPWARAQSLHAIGGARFMANAEKTAFGACGALAIITAPGDRKSTLHAGAMMIETWAKLNAMHLAVQPWYILSRGSFCNGLTDAPSGVATDLQALLTSFDEAAQCVRMPKGHYIHMVLRVGLPKRDAVRSQRLPIEALFA